MTGRYDNYSMIINFIITRDVMKYIFQRFFDNFYLITTLHIVRETFEEIFI